MPSSTSPPTRRVEAGALGARMTRRVRRHVIDARPRGRFASSSNGASTAAAGGARRSGSFGRCAQSAPEKLEHVTVRRIAYQGEPGSNSHLVCKQHYADWEAVACASFEDVFAAVENGAMPTWR